MEERSGTKREIDLGENFDVAVKVNGVRIEVGIDGSIVAYTKNSGNVVSPANDDVPRAAPNEPEPGERMKDGTRFAGISPDTGKALYVMPQDAPLTMKWKTAMQYAANLDAHGHKDWKLPSKAELAVLFENRAKIGNFNTSGSFTAGYYWSSSDNNSSDAWTQRFSDGLQLCPVKNNGLSLRYVRTGPLPKPQ